MLLALVTARRTIWRGSWPPPGSPIGRMVIHYRGLAGTMTWRSFHAAAMWTYSEGDQPLRRVRYKEQPEGLFLGSRDGENAFHRAPDDVVVQEGHDPSKVGHRKCVSCGRDFQPARPWSTFCSPACRLRTHRRARRDESRKIMAVSEPVP
jgi:hypothetical protein